MLSRRAIEIAATLKPGDCAWYLISGNVRNIDPQLRRVIIGRPIPGKPRSVSTLGNTISVSMHDLGAHDYRDVRSILEQMAAERGWQIKEELGDVWEKTRDRLLVFRKKK